MRYIPFFTMLMSSLCLAATPEDMALKYASYFSAGDFKAAAKMIYCGEELSVLEVKEKRIGLEKELQFFEKEFGEIENYWISKDYAYVGATIGCAPKDFLKRTVSQLENILIALSHRDGERGFIVVSILVRGGALLPVMLSHGIPMNGSVSVERIQNVYKKLGEI